MPSPTLDREAMNRGCPSGRLGLLYPISPETTAVRSTSCKEDHPEMISTHVYAALFSTNDELGVIFKRFELDDRVEVRDRSA